MKKKSNAGKALAITGGILFGAGYFPVAGIGIIGAGVVCPAFHGGEDGLGNCSLSFARGFIPVAGPFFFVDAFGGTSTGGGKLMILDGVLQGAGVVTFATGIILDLNTPQVLVPDFKARGDTHPSIRVVPILGGTTTGAMLVGHF